MIDDEPSVLEFLVGVLSDEGHIVDTASNGAAALEKLRTREYDLVLLDVKLPGMSGGEVYHAIERMSRCLVGKVVLITGDIDGSDTRTFLARTGAKYLTKPFDTSALKQVIHSVMQAKHNPLHLSLADLNS